MNTFKNSYQNSWRTPVAGHTLGTNVDFPIFCANRHSSRVNWQFNKFSGYLQTLVWTNILILLISWEPLWQLGVFCVSQHFCPVLHVCGNAKKSINSPSDKSQNFLGGLLLCNWDCCCQRDQINFSVKSQSFKTKHQQGTLFRVSKLILGF